MSNTKNTEGKATLPKTLTMGGITYAVEDNPELKQFVNEIQKTVAQTEKAKLYSQIKALQEEIEILTKTPILTSNEKKETPVIDVEKLKNEIMEGMAEKFTVLMNNALSPIIEKTKLDQAAEIENYRNKLITENQGKCIPELVVGKTKEELDASLKNSMSIFAKYGKIETPLGPNGALPVTQTTTTSAGNVPTTATNTQATTPVQEAAPSAPPFTPPAVTTVADENIKGMSIEEFARRREELQAKLANLINV
jgi:hypothetical protein